tara:strand:- start:406 stop:1116 length:711 start_codon:yes stop_codon:yes gene_type:complete
MSNIIIGTSPNSSGLGDVLLLTPLCREFPDSTVELTPEAAGRFGSLFNGIANVRVTETPTITKDVGGGHFANRKLRGHGRGDVNYLPEIKLIDEEIEWANKVISKYDNPIIFAPNTALRNKNQREFDPMKWQVVIDHLSQTKTVLQFGMSSNFTPFNNTIMCKDNDVRQTAALYSSVGHYMGVDTGDMHLMLAVSGNVTVLVPNSKPDYQHDQWHYKHPSAKYILFENYEDILETI